MTQHKWHTEIKAWADGAEIEFNNFHNKDLWMLDTTPDWNATHGGFRIKPQPKEPQYLYVYGNEYVTTISTKREISGVPLIGKIPLIVEGE